jgi:hypothetical protein
MATVAPSVRFLAPTLIVKGVDSLVSVDVERNGAALNISGSPTLAVTDSEGTAISGSPFSVTQSGTVLSATITAAGTASADYAGNWLVMLSFTVSGERAYTAYNAAALVRTELNPPVGVGDLEARNGVLTQIQANGRVSLQGHIDQAWGELLSRLYSDESPFWTVRSPAAFRPWLLSRSMEIALRDAGATLGAANPYTREADRLAGLLEEQYLTLQVRLDDEQANTMSERSSPVVDTRRRS